MEKTMTHDQWTAVDNYFAGLFAPPDPALEAALQATADAGMPLINVAPNQGKLLYLLARAHAARSILEIGTLGGYSTIWLARALPPGGRLVTLEIDPAHAAVARANIERAGLAGQSRCGSGRRSQPSRSLSKLAPARSTWCSSTPTSRARPTTWPGRCG
jgi:predicted O-methyltransferase YrrM